MKSKNKALLDNNEQDDFELAFAFKNCKLQPYFEQDFVSDEEQEQIRNTVKEIENIYIDKTYVDCKDNKHSDTFLNENGWNQLKESLIDSNFSSEMSFKSCENLVDVFVSMIKAYAYQMLCKDHDIDILEHVQIVLKNKNKIQVEISKDTSNEWKTYPGKWQTWSDNFINNKLKTEKSRKTNKKKKSN